MSDNRLELELEISSFLTYLTNSVVKDDVDDSAAISEISTQITVCDDKLKCFLEEFDDIDDILEKYNPLGDKGVSKDQLDLDILKMRVKNELRGGKRGKKTYKKRVRSRKTHKKRVMSRKFRMRRSNRLRSKVLG